MPRMFLTMVAKGSHHGRTNLHKDRPAQGRQSCVISSATVRLKDVRFYSRTDLKLDLDR